MIIDFGKYKGKKVDELPLRYCEELLHYSFNQPQMSLELKEEIRGRVDRIHSSPEYKEWKENWMKDLFNQGIKTRFPDFVQTDQSCDHIAPNQWVNFGQI